MTGIVASPQHSSQDAHWLASQTSAVLSGKNWRVSIFIQEVSGILLCRSVCLSFSFQSYRRFSFSHRRVWEPLSPGPELVTCWSL